MKHQLVIPGLEPYMSEPATEKWTPVAHTLAKIKAYFLGYVVNGKPIKCRIRYVADKLKLGIRTIFRYLAHLKEIGWLRTIKRRARHAVREVDPLAGLQSPQPLQNQDYNPPTGTSPGTCIEVNSESPEYFTDSVEVDGHAPILARLRREMPSPLVLFRDIRSRFAAKHRHSELERWAKEQDAIIAAGGAASAW